MLIIIEGPDKSGKSTLAREIEKRFGYSYAHFGAPGPDPAGEYARFLLNLKGPTVCDRFYLGEQVYGPLLRGKSVITNLQKAVIERLCRYRGAILIYAGTPLEVCQERLAKSKYEDVTVDQNAKAWEMFRSIITECSIMPVCHYDSSKSDSVNKLIKELETPLAIMRAMSGLARVYCTGLGTIQGDKMVVVGEKLNDRISWIGKPFDKGVSSEFLYSCFREAGIPESKTYFVNAATLTIEEAMFLQFGDTTPWLALGNEAHEKLNSLQITHSNIPHPQYWKRFHGDERGEYIGMLKLWKSKYNAVRQNRV